MNEQVKRKKIRQYYWWTDILFASIMLSILVMIGWGSGIQYFTLYVIMGSLVNYFLGGLLIILLSPSEKKTEILMDWLDQAPATFLIFVAVNLWPLLVIALWTGFDDE